MSHYRGVIAPNHPQYHKYKKREDIHFDNAKFRAIKVDNIERETNRPLSVVAMTPLVIGGVIERNMS